MKLQQYVARQLSHPTGIVGKVVVGRLWNSRNAELNDVTLAHLELEEEDRVLDTGGKVVLTFTCKKDLEQKGFVQYGVRTYNEEEVRDLLIHAGFSDVKVRRGWDRHREFVCLTGRK